MMTVEQVLEKGHLISREAIEIIEKDTTLLNDISEDLLVIRRKDLINEKKEATFSVIFESSNEKNDIEVSDLVGFYNNRIEKLKSDIISQTDEGKLVSINNVDKKDVVLIGMVREVNENGFVLEDLSGSSQIVSKNKPPEDSVIGVECEYTGVLTEKKILYPDIPKVEHKESKGKILVLNSSEKLRNMNLEGITHIFLNEVNEEDIKNIEPEIITSSGEYENSFLVNSPSRIKIDNTEIMIFDNENITPENAINLVRGRHLNPGKVITNDPYLLDSIPDIAICVSKKDIFLNYKGLILLSPGDTSFSIDLNGMSIEEIKV